MNLYQELTGLPWHNRCEARVRQGEHRQAKGTGYRPKFRRAGHHECAKVKTNES